MMTTPPSDPAGAGSSAWTSGEMMAVAASRLIRDEDVALVGLGLPQIAAFLAKLTHAPRAALLLEIGVFDPKPREPAMGVADPRAWAGSAAHASMPDVLGYMLHGGRVTLGILGTLQVDSTGNVNSTLVREGDGGGRRFLGSGGANDIATTAGRVVVVMQHQARKFKKTVDFITSPGRLVAGRPRRDAGLDGEGTAAVVTDRAVIEVTDNGAVLSSIHPGEDADRLLAETPMDLALPEEGPATTDAPTAEQLMLIREELDPHRWYTGPRRIA